MTDSFLDMDTIRYFEPKEKNSARGQRVSPIIFRSPSFREIEVSKEHAKKKLVEQQQRIINIPKGLGNTMAIQQTIQADIIKAQKYLKLLQKIRVDQLGSIYYSGGLSRKHPTGLGRLDVAAILLPGDVAYKACNDVSALMFQVAALFLSGEYSKCYLQKTVYSS
jgi:hypothetical protein